MDNKKREADRHACNSGIGNPRGGRNRVNTENKKKTPAPVHSAPAQPHNVHKAPKIDGPLNCACINLDTITNKKEELQYLIQDLELQILAVTEVKPKTARYKLQETELSIEGFEKFPNLDGSRGVCLYVKTELRATKNEALSSSNFEESVWCNIKLQDNTCLCVGCIYRSPNSEEKNNKELEALLKEASSLRGIQLLIMGDFNHPEINWLNETYTCSDKHHAARFLECTRDCYLTQHVTKPTHYRGDQKANTLDLVLSNEEDLVINVDVRAPVGKSHHGVVTFHLNVATPEVTTKPASYCFDKGDYGKMSQEIQDMDWNLEFENKSVEQNWGLFMEKVKVSQDKWIPRRKSRKLPYRKPKPLWMNEKALSKVKKKHSAWKRYLETRDGESYREYCKARNQARKATRQATREFEQKLVQEIKTNPKAFYKYVQSKTKSRSGIGDLKHEGRMATEDPEKAEILNNFFASVFTKEDPGQTPNVKTQSVKQNLTNIEFTEEQVTKKLKMQNPNKSTGPDGIHPRVLRELAGPLSVPLTLIFNQSMRTGELPEAWRKGNITPIYKKGPRDNPGNYRPVSLTSVVCKVMESLVRDHIITHMVDNNLFAKQQHGFTSGKSCMTQLLEVIEEWTAITDVRGSLDAVYFDFQKAFDSVPHRRLLSKIHSYGIGGQVASWLTAFLSNRQQRVSVNQHTSSWQPVESGVPQGSVIGPILFVIYINDLPDAINHTIQLFADDTKLYSKIESVEDCEGMQQDINRLQDWSDKWLLRFHPAKCKVMRIGPNQPDFQYHMRESSGKLINLSTVESEKDLGVTFDNNLTFDQHIADTVSKANRIMGMIRRSFVFLDGPTFSNLFKMLVRPHLEYGNIIWAPYKRKHIDELEQVQRRGTKLVPGLQHLEYEERLKVLKLPSLEYRRVRGDIIEMYKYTHGSYKVETPWLHFDASSRTRGHTLKLKKLSCATEKRRHVFSYRTTNIWNALPQEVVDAPSVDALKGRIDKHLSKLCYSTRISFPPAMKSL
jgi:endonuclease/exonuclease/phosphatase family metal-dependent hydrolase